MTKSLSQKLLILIYIFCSGCTIIGYDGPYEGKVVDVDTRKPIEGTVVSGDWSRVHPGPGGATSSYYDYKEILTDKNGEFKLDGAGLLILSNIEQPIVTVFKAGYTQKSSYWSNLKDNKSPEVDVVGNKLVFKLKRMTLEERQKRSVDMRGPGTIDKNRLMWLEYNKEMIESGRTSVPVFPVK